MKQILDRPSRINYIGGSDARIIMGKDEKPCCGCGRRSAVKWPHSTSQAS